MISIPYIQDITAKLKCLVYMEYSSYDPRNLLRRFPLRSNGLRPGVLTAKKLPSFYAGAKHHPLPTNH